MPKKWIQKAVAKMKEKGTEGALREQLGTKKGKLSSAAKEGGKLGKRAQVALNANKES